MKNLSLVFQFVALVLSTNVLSEPSTHLEGQMLGRMLDPSDKCSIDNLTKQCSMFSADKPQKIELPDGTFIPNFAAIAKVLEQERESKKDIPTPAASKNELVDKYESEKTKLL